MTISAEAVALWNEAHARLQLTRRGSKTCPSNWPSSRPSPSGATARLVRHRAGGFSRRDAALREDRADDHRLDRCYAVRHRRRHPHRRAQGPRPRRAGAGPDRADRSGGGGLRRGRCRRLTAQAADRADAAVASARRWDRCTACRSRTRTCTTGQAASRPAARSCAPTGARAYTATALTRLDAAGAIELGRLVMVEFAMGPHGYNENYPQCRNPWNPQYIPCGSSSGSGVAVAAAWCMGRWARIPAARSAAPAAVSAWSAWCRPTAASAATARCRCRSLDVVGPLARTARDCARLLDVIAGHDPEDASSLRRAGAGLRELH